MARVELVFQPAAGLIQPVRLFVRDFFEHVLKDAEAAGNLAIAVHELLENAMKAVSNDSVRLLIEAESSQSITVQTENTVNDAELAIIAGMIDGMQQAAGAGEHYKKLVHQTSTRLAGSGLGLGRVWAECGLELSYTVIDRRVTVNARTPSSTSA